jgi:hypothetical protein
METPTVTKQSSPAQQQHSNNNIMKVVHLNVGGQHYKVSCSLLDMHPNSLLAQSAEEEVFLDCDGHRFRLVLDYLRGDGHVILPLTVHKPLFLSDLAYYGIENVDASKIVYHFGTASPCLADIEEELSTKMRDEIQAWYGHRAIALLAKECASQYMTSGGKLDFEIPGPATHMIHCDPKLYSFDTWSAVYNLLHSTENIFPPSALEECNKYLVKAGLEIMGVRQMTSINSIHVYMMLTNV